MREIMEREKEPRDNKDTDNTSSVSESTSTSSSDNDSDTESTEDSESSYEPTSLQQSTILEQITTPDQSREIPNKTTCLADGTNGATQANMDNTDTILMSPTARNKGTLTQNINSKRRRRISPLTNKIKRTKDGPP